MAGMKIEALIAARVAELRAEVAAEERALIDAINEQRALIDAIDEELGPFVEQVWKLDARVSKLEGEGVSAPTSD